MTKVYVLTRSEKFPNDGNQNMGVFESINGAVKAAIKCNPHSPTFQELIGDVANWVFHDNSRYIMTISEVTDISETYIIEEHELEQ